MTFQENHETFFARINPLFSPSEELGIRLAYIMAKAGHRNQFRKEVDSSGKPLRYFEHPRRVAIILLDELNIVDCDMIITAFLHDGLEDIRALTAQMLETYFGKNVCRMVKLLTKTDEHYWDRLSNRGDWSTIVVKCCDRLDNLRSLKAGSVEFQQKQLKETKEKFYPLLDHLIENLSVDENSKKISKQLRNSIRDIVQQLDG